MNNDFDDLVEEQPHIYELTDASITTITTDAGRLAHPPLPGLRLTDEQLQAIDRMTTWAKAPGPKRQFFFGGFAGTGKTTVIKELLRILRQTENVAVSAFTGKACNVLMRKGIPAQTLHSLMYDVVEDPKDGSIEFVPKPFMAGEPSIVIVDEASMVNRELLNTLTGYNKRVIFVGDPGQLEPVGDNPNLMRTPDFVLTKIHRQAEENPILRMATQTRNGIWAFPYGLTETSDDQMLRIKDKSITSEELLACSQCICAKNKTRTFLNNSLRQFKKLPVGQIVEGEKLICLRNNSMWNVFNGMILFVDSIKQERSDTWLCNLKDEDGKLHPNIPVWKEPFTDPKFDAKDPTLRISKRVVYCDYGYVITCHKSQGSEWPHVWVYDEWMPPQVWDMRRWRYTAITRAAKKLTYCKDKR